MLFTDLKGGYSLRVPARWIALDVSKGGLAAAIRAQEAKNPSNAQVLRAAARFINQGMRFMAVDTNPEHITEGVPSLLFTLMDETMPDLPVDFVLEAMAQSLPATGSAEVLSQEMMTSPSGLEYGQLDVVVTAPNAEGNQARVFERLVMFKSGEKTVIVFLVSHEKARKVAQREFAEIIESIRILQP